MCKVTQNNAWPWTWRSTVILTVFVISTVILIHDTVEKDTEISPIAREGRSFKQERDLELEGHPLRYWCSSIYIIIVIRDLDYVRIDNEILPLARILVYMVASLEMLFSRELEFQGHVVNMRTLFKFIHLSLSYFQQACQISSRFLAKFHPDLFPNSIQIPRIVFTSSNV